MRKKGFEGKSLRFRATLFTLVLCLCMFILNGCGGTTYDESTAGVGSEEIGFENYKEIADTVAEDEAEPEEVDAGTEGNADMEEKKDTASQQEQDKILVYTGAVSIDTMEFEETVRAFKKAVEGYGGFLENEQNYGAGSKYAEESFYSAENPRTFLATARIPSEKYQEFMDKTQGLGVVTESNSQVTNMTRQYGTLKAELEIYEAEYERYLKMFDEVSEDSAMLAIQEKLTQLSLDIARTKSEMAVIDTDSMYSTVEMRIQEVTAFKEKGAGFFDRLANVLSESWQGMLRFFEAILFFFILHWYKLLLLFLIIFFVVKFVKKYQVKKSQQRQQIMQTYQARQQNPQGAKQQMQGAQQQRVPAQAEKEEVPREAENKEIPRETEKEENLQETEK